MTSARRCEAGTERARKDRRGDSGRRDRRREVAQTQPSSRRERTLARGTGMAERGSRGCESMSTNRACAEFGGRPRTDPRRATAGAGQAGEFVQDPGQGRTDGRESPSAGRASTLQYVSKAWRKRRFLPAAASSCRAWHSSKRRALAAAGARRCNLPPRHARSSQGRARTRLRRRRAVSADDTTSRSAFSPTISRSVFG